jgi:hypothetical protein
MTHAERCAAVVAMGFTPRQAAFLVTVMIHAGVCVPRQYTSFAGIVFGQKTRDFFAALTRRGMATAYPCWRGVGRLYHVHHKGLYRAIGEPDNRHRRAVTVGRAIERLMALDVVLGDRSPAWLGTEREKTAYFTERCGIDAADLPALVFVQRGGRTVRHFPEKLPIGLTSDGHPVFVYLAIDASGRALRSFLTSHAALLRRLRRWTIRLVLPAAAGTVQASHTAIVHEFVSAPVRAGVLEEFRWFCHRRAALEQGAPVIGGGTDATRYAVARRAFGAPRFFATYRTWRQSGDGALDALLSPRLHEAWTRGDGRLEVQVLPYQYQHLAAATATA